MPLPGLASPKTLTKRTSPSGLKQAPGVTNVNRLIGLGLAGERHDLRDLGPVGERTALT